MRFVYANAFQSMWKKLPTNRREKAREALLKLEEALKGGKKPEGLGLKKLRIPFWEVRTNLKDRILFSLEGDLITLALIGNHDEVHRFLRSH